MGKITSGGMEDVKIKVPRGGGGAMCSAELVGYLSCLELNAGDESKCTATREALGACMKAAASNGASQRRHKVPINYHLQQVCISFS